MYVQGYKKGAHDALAKLDEEMARQARAAYASASVDDEKAAAAAVRQELDRLTRVQYRCVATRLLAGSGGQRAARAPARSRGIVAGRLKLGLATRPQWLVLHPLPDQAHEPKRPYSTACFTRPASH